jgi:uncharacterized membrane protein
VNLKEYHTLFLVVTLGLILVAASPMLSVVVPEVSSERFSEFWLLGPDHMADGYPFSVGVGEEYTAFVGVGNHMSASEYYIVYVKFGNGTEYLPDVDSGVASLFPLYEFRFFVGDGEVWESSVTFGFEDVFVEGDVLSVGEIVVDGVSFPVNVSAVWESEDGGYFFQLFFELWRYDDELDGFRFDDRLVGLWLNMTG